MVRLSLLFVFLSGCVLIFESQTEVADGGPPKDGNNLDAGVVGPDAGLVGPDASSVPPFDASGSLFDANADVSCVDSVDAGPACITADRRRVFVSSSFHNGNFGGLAGADIICRDLASNAGLSETFIAFLSDSTINAPDRLNGGGPWFLTGTEETLVACNKNDLIDDCLAAAIMKDEVGEAVTGGPLNWTGTSVSGVKANNCDDWTLADPSLALVGDRTKLSNLFMGQQSSACQSPLRIYCFEVP